jgi:hypothetical protein
MRSSLEMRLSQKPTPVRVTLNCETGEKDKATHNPSSTWDTLMQSSHISNKPSILLECGISSMIDSATHFPNSVECRI